ncbi:probable molybdenum cofactor guanylyltransferase [Intestinibacter bartlettii CAG:1329]|uniref:Probable molybdenum cofactor guanylyltransferase n=1 Tax=Intestinibacter bartlettii CAG:1329 TaxID=1263063 RepID=R5X760_9FIRM|nr:molybdenum cofactor guanylyltransferase [Intestinibacter bartlettii]CDA10630.1 probable molybdenum cofactor guanylyltransferase [Intestinibacter bartlettii CAG:1329]
MDIGALILMGGKNSRMNGNVKGLLKIKNSTFLEKIQETLNDFSSIYLSINDKFSKEQKQNFENRGFKIIEDIYKEIGPLGGIYSSLLNCKEEYLFITACDMPFITKNSIEVLCNKVDKNTDGVVFYDKNNKLYPLGAIYSKNVLPIIEEMIEKKYYKLSYLIEKSNFVKINIEKTDIPLKVLSNINTLQEYDLFINNESLF